MQEDVLNNECVCRENNTKRVLIKSTIKSHECYFYIFEIPTTVD